MAFTNIFRVILHGCRAENFPSALFPFKLIRCKPPKRYRKNEYFGGRRAQGSGHTVSTVALAKVEG